MVRALLLGRVYRGGGLEVTALTPVRVFISYSHRDAADRAELVSHLGGLVLDGILEICDDRRIRAGDDWQDKLREFLGQAEIILLLVSNEFVGSRECQKETEIALQLLEAGKARVIPVLIRQVYVGSRLGRLQFLLGNRPIPSTGEARDLAFTEIARNIQEVALEIRTPAPKTGKRSAPTLMEKLNSVALSLADQGRPREALEILDGLIETLDHKFGDENEDVAALLSNRGLVRQDLGDLEGARQDLERAKVISQEILGPDHPVVARRLANLGGALLELGDEEDKKYAWRLLNRAFTSLEGAGAASTPDLLLAGLHLGDAIESDPGRAKVLLERVLTVDEKEPRAAAAAHSTLGRIAFRESRFGDALNYFLRAIESTETIYDGEHPWVGIDLHNLGLTYRALGNVTEAREALQRALAILVPQFSAGNPRVLQTEKALALLAATSTSAPR